jgi:hypothetical protein
MAVKRADDAHAYRHIYVPKRFSGNVDLTTSY